MASVDMDKFAENMIKMAQAAISSEDRSLDEIRDAVKSIQEDGSEDIIIEMVSRIAVGFFVMGAMFIMTEQHVKESVEDGKEEDSVHAS